MIILIRFIAGVVTAGIISLFGFTSNVNAATLLIKDGFESGNLSKWSYSGDEISGAQVHSGTKALHYDGWPGTEVRISPARDVFLRLWWYFPPEFSGGWASGRHFWRFRTGVGQSQIDTQAQAKPNGFSIAYLEMGSSGAGWYPNAAQLPKGRWFKLEFYSRINSPGVANGETALWIDGVQKFRHQDVTLTNNGNGFNLFQLTTNYNASACPSDLVCDWYMDDVEVWNGCPPGSPCGGWSTTEPSTEPPVKIDPPSNLRVIILP